MLIHKASKFQTLRITDWTRKLYWKRKLQAENKLDKQTPAQYLAAIFKHIKLLFDACFQFQQHIVPNSTNLLESKNLWNRVDVSELAWIIDSTSLET